MWQPESQPESKTGLISIKKPDSTNAENIISGEINGNLIPKVKRLMLKSNVPINIIADDREQKSEVIRSLSGMENVKLEIQRLSLSAFSKGRPGI